MGYEYNVYLPGLGRTVMVGEINARLYRDLVKSLYNSEVEPFLVHLNTVITLIVPGIQLERITILDYLVILINARMICINPDLRLTTTCPETKRRFDVAIKLEDVATALQRAKISNTITYKNISLDYSLLKAKDIIDITRMDNDLRSFYLLVSSVDKVVVGKTEHILNGSFSDRVSLINALPAPLTNLLEKQLNNTYDQLQDIELISLKSPFVKGLVVSRLPLTVDLKEITFFLKLVFNDDLASVYRLAYNLVSKAHFNPQFLDTITPAEQALFWSFYLQQTSKENEEYDRGKPDTNAPKYEGVSQQTGPSEFS